ncbi:SDR family NAD(P)-dependent oxidoreductase [Winogradskyella litoriviva]|uniref:SDR family NAD(P)-dependent oxidoreductase n=1 Tax=Winogradskyella litoriviva TaxID=1220182 RepID=A0ABX2E790_9FLAO|nr:SDR family NAD(P)-dependent oxidoreductase [Winogradskyella litoriviva]NRD23659.1 SDR family NAD(P)-dependent oxidoreductase [Winogradskyella litoriviva]
MKHILITGSTDGIGKLTALKLAKDGNTVYIHGRSETKVNNVIKEIKEASKNDNIKGFVADFSDLNAVKQMAAQIKKEVSSLDILINNAGIYKSPSEKTIDGLDIRIAVNYLASYILTETILPVLQKGSATRIINLSSAAQSTVQKGVLTGDAKVNASESYAQSKLALTMWSFYFAKNHSKIVTIAVNPGSLLNTKMAKEAYGQHWSPAEKGVDILYDLAVSERHKNHSGTYFDNDRGSYSNAHPDAYNDNKIKLLLTLTESIISN